MEGAQALVLGLGLAWIAQDPRWAVAAVALAALPVAFDPHPRTAPREAWWLALALLVAFAGFRIDGVNTPNGGYWALGAWSAPASAVWITLIRYALGFVGRQGSPRLLLQVAWVISLAFLALTLLQPQALAVALAVGACAVLGWCLWRGLAPSPMGAQAIGTVLAMITIAGMVKTSATLALLGPVLILGLPPLTFHQTLGILPGILPGRMAGVAPGNPTAISARGAQPALLGLYATLSGAAVLLTAWAHHPAALDAWPLGLGLFVLGALALWACAPEAAAGWAADPRRIELFGTPIDRVDRQAALKRAAAFLDAGRPHVIATPDTTALMRAKADPQLRACYAAADLVTPDGMGLVWASRWLGAPLAERVAGIDLLDALCALAARRGLRVFLLGARPGVVEAAARRLQRAHPGLEVAGALHGYFADDRPVVEAVRAARPDLLFAGLGAPRQERWLLQHRDALGVPVTMGVGGSFDVLAGRLRRAPRWMQESGLEWLYRLCLQPARIGRTLCIPVFLCGVLQLKLARLRYRSLGSTTSASSS